MILELAGGTGELAAVLAPSVAQVIYTDFSPAMVDAARRRATPGVDHRVLDMQAIDLPDASFDGVVCRYGYMLVPDPALAMRETRRVLRPGGRLALATWAGAKRNPWATRYGPVLIERGLQEPPKPGAPGQFALGEPEQIESLVRAAASRTYTSRRSRSSSASEAGTITAGSSPCSQHRARAARRAGRGHARRGRRGRPRPLRALPTNPSYVLPGVALVASAS